MTLTTGSTYQATIGPFTAGSVLEYYITALDNSTSHNEAIEDNSGLYYSFTISIYITEFLMFSPIVLTMTLVSVIYCVRLLQRKKSQPP